MLERTEAITNEVLEPITFVLAYPTAVYFQGQHHYCKNRLRTIHKAQIQILWEAQETRLGIMFLFIRKIMKNVIPEFV
jgi:hypothetical protein